MKKVVFAAALLVLVAGPTVMAGPLDAASFTSDFFPRPEAIEGGPVALPYSTGFEAPFVVGHINAQQGWQTGAAPDTWPRVSNVNPFGGTQDMAMENDPAAPTGFASILGFGPSHALAKSYSVMMNISNLGGADYWLNPQDPALALSCTRVNFNFTAGAISVIVDADGPGAGAAAFVNTGVNYTPGVYKEFRIVQDAANKYSYFYDGVNITPGGVPQFGFHNAGGATCNGWAEMVYIDDQFQLAGEAGRFDDHTELVPEPGTLALLGFGIAGLLLRRRVAA